MPQFRRTLPTLVSLLIGFALMQTGGTLLGTLLSLRGALENFSPVQIGLIAAAFWVGVVAGSLRCGGLIRRVGHTRAFSALAAVASAAALLHLLVIDPLVWVLARAITGFCFAGLYMVVESWLNAAAVEETRGRILSLYGLTGFLAGVCGQLLLPAGDPSGFRLFCLVSMLIALALVPVAVSRARAPNAAKISARIDIALLYRRAPFGVGAALLCGASTGSFFALGPVFAHSHGFDAGEIAVFMACAALGGAVMIWPLGRLSDRLDRRNVIMAAAGAASLVLLVLRALEPEDAPPWSWFVCAALIGGAITPTYSIVAAHVNDVVETGEFIAASGGLLILQGAGASLGPLFSGAAMTRFGSDGMLDAIIASQLALLLYGVFRVSQRGALPHAPSIFQPEPVLPVGGELELQRPALTFAGVRRRD